MLKTFVKNQILKFVYACDYYELYHKIRLERGLKDMLKAKLKNAKDIGPILKKINKQYGNDYLLDYHFDLGHGLPDGKPFSIRKPKSLKYQDGQVFNMIVELDKYLVQHVGDGWILNQQNVNAYVNKDGNLSLSGRFISEIFNEGIKKNQFNKKKCKSQLKEVNKFLFSFEVRWVGVLAFFGVIPPPAGGHHKY